MPAHLDRELLFANTYHPAGQHLRQQLTAYAGYRLVTLVNTTFRYDRAGRLREARTTMPKYLGSRVKRTFVTTSGFDAAGRLTGEAHADAAGRGKLTCLLNHRTGRYV